MKRKLLKILLIICFGTIFVLGLIACGEQESKLVFKTLEVDGREVYGKVSNNTEYFSFAGEIEVKDNATYGVSKDQYGEQSYVDKVVPLEEGDNIFYIFETVGDKMTTYTVTIRRRPMYTISFETQCGSVVENQMVEEDALAKNPTTDPIKLGYTFSGWSHDFTKPITKNLTIEAAWTVNTEMSIFRFTSTETTCEITGLIDKTATTVVIPDYVTSIGGAAFFNCNNLADIEIPNSVTNIGYYAFGYCSSLTSVVIGDNVTSIGSYAFTYCSAMTSITLPNDLTSIDVGTFSDCRSLIYSVKNGLKYLGNNENPYLYLAGRENKHITTAAIDNNCKLIGYSAFAGCSSLTSIEIPNSVTSIGDAAFRGCSSLTSIEIPNGVTSMGGAVFRDCSSLTYTVKHGLKYLGNNNNAYLYLVGVENTSIRITMIDSNCKWIDSSVFAACRNLTSIEIPNSVTSIGYYAFGHCSSLTSVVLGDNVTSIGDAAFAGCDSLTIYCEAASQPSGWELDWNSDNRPVYWYSETQPTTDGNYWHYVDGVPTKWE